MGIRLQEYERGWKLGLDARPALGLKDDNEGVFLGSEGQ